MEIKTFVIFVIFVTLIVNVSAELRGVDFSEINNRCSFCDINLTGYGNISGTVTANHLVFATNNNFLGNIDNTINDGGIINLQYNQDIDTDFTVSYFGSDPSARIDGSQTGLFWSSCSIGTCSLDYKTLSGNYYKIKALGFIGDGSELANIKTFNSSYLTSVNYNNLAWVNQTNTFAENQTFGKNIEITKSFNGSGYIIQNKTVLLHTSGNGNLFIGSYQEMAGNLTTTGQYNLGFGRAVMPRLSTGQSNFGAGNAALNSVTTGSYNMCQGSNACQSVTTGLANCMVGTGAFTFGLGSYNSGIGDGAWGNLRGSADGNSCFGRACGSSVVNGNYNLFMGYNSGSTPLQRNTSYCIAIGGSNTAPSYCDKNNQMVLGMNITNETIIWGTKNTTMMGNVNILGNLSVKRPYAMYSDTGLQVIAVSNTAYPVRFNVTEDDYQIIKTNNENITFQQTGDYLIEISAIVTTDTANKHVEIWVQKNGVDVPRSNTKVEFSNPNLEQVISVPFILDMNTTDKMRIMWASDDAGSSMVYVGATAYSPETPSIIMTINKISEIT